MIFSPSWAHSYSADTAVSTAFLWSSRLPWLGLLLSAFQGIHMHLEIPDALPESSTSSPNSWNCFTRCKDDFTAPPGKSICVLCSWVCLSLVPAAKHSWTTERVWQLYQRECSKEKKKSFFPPLRSHFTGGSQSSVAWSKLLQNVLSIFFFLQQFSLQRSKFKKQPLLCIHNHHSFLMTKIFLLD